MSDDHEQQWIAKLPDGSFDLTKDLARRRGLREMVMPAKAEHSLPIPATFVVDVGGIIRFAYANTNYMYRADPADVLAALATCSWR